MMNWTVLSTVLGVTLILSATILKIAGTGRRETCMKKFENIEKKEAVNEEKFARIEKELREIKDEQKSISTKLDKLMFLLPKRSINHDNGG